MSPGANYRESGSSDSLSEPSILYLRSRWSRSARPSSIIEVPYMGVPSSGNDAHNLPFPEGNPVPEGNPNFQVTTEAPNQSDGDNPLVELLQQVLEHLRE